MPQININGAQPGGPGSRQIAKPGTPYGPQQYRQGVASDYGKAMAQQARQMSEEAAKQRQQNRSYANYEQDQKRQQAKLDKLTADEIRQRERDLAADRKAASDRERQRRADEAAAIRLQRQKDMEALRRGREEWSLRRTFSHMQHTAGGNLSPTALRNMYHRADIFHERLGAFQRRWGQSAYYGGNINDLTKGLGTPQGAYRVQDVLRMGSTGQRAAFEGNYTELVRIERELKRIEHVNDKQFRFATSPAAQANLERQKNALLDARSRIQAGLSGHGALYNAAGRGYGRLMNTFHNPLARTAMDVAATVVAAPYVGNRMFSGIVGMQAPWLNYDIAAQGLARGAGGGFHGVDVLRTMVNMNKAGMAPGAGLSSYAQMFGLDPKHTMQAITNLYGVPLRHPYDATHIAASVRMASLAGGMNLPEDQIFKMLGGATSMGIVGRNQAGRDQYLRQLQKTMAVATREGVDQSKLAAGWQTFVQTAASSGLGSHLGSLSSFFRGLMSSGAPGARTGQMQASIFAGTQQAIQGIGVTGNSGMNIAVMSALGSRLPTTEAELTKSLGITIDHKNPAQVKALQNYLAAAKNHSPFALEMLQPLLSGQSPDTLRKFLEKSPLLRSMPIGMRNVAEANLMGISVTQLTAMQAAKSGTGAAAMKGLMPYQDPNLKFVLSKQSDQTGLSRATIGALVMTESSGNPTAHNGSAVGLTQVTPGAVADYNKAHGTSYTMADVTRNQSLNLDIGTWYYQKMLTMAGGNQTLAYGMYNWGPAHKNDILTGNVPAEYKNNMARFDRNLAAGGDMEQVLKDQRTLALGGAADLQGSRYITEVSDKVVAAFTTAAGAVDALSQAASRAANTLNAIGAVQHMTGGFVAPDGSYVPNDHSRRVSK